MRTTEYAEIGWDCLVGRGVGHGTSLPTRATSASPHSTALTVHRGTSKTVTGNEVVQG